MQMCGPYNKIPPRRRQASRLTRPAPPLRMVPMSETFSSRLAAITLPDVDGKQQTLGSFWADGPAVVVFLRHYG